MIDILNFPDLVDTLVIGDRISPGTVTLTGHDRGHEWDTQKASGQTGATSKYAGEKLAEFQAAFFLADVEDQLAWPAFQRLLESTVNGPSPKALAIYHPDLASNRITEVCLVSVGGPIRDARGGVTIQVKLIEYRPPKPKPVQSATAAASSAADKQGNQQKYDPNRAAKDELAALLAEARDP